MDTRQNQYLRRREEILVEAHARLWPAGRRVWSRFSWIGLALVLVFAAINLFAQAEDDEDVGLKAKWLGQILRATTWPASAFKITNDTIVLGIIGKDPFGAKLTVEGVRLNGRTVVVKRFDSVEAAKGSQVVFVGVSESKRLAEILEAFKSQNVLTFGVTREFVRLGGIVNLTFNEKKYFEFSKKAYESSGLNIDSRVLALGKKLE